MALISGTIPNFINGVSQQAVSLRLASQAEEQVNGLASVADGFKKRPPAVHIARLMNSLGYTPGTHFIDRDATERYIVTFKNGDLLVHALDGTAKTVNFPNGKTYLNTAAPSTDIVALTVADYTFIANKTVATALSGTLSPSRPFEALVNIKEGNYGRKYQINVNGVNAGSTTMPTGGTPSDVVYLDTTNIIVALIADITTQAVLTSGNGYTTTASGNVLHIQRTSDFTISVDDGFAGKAASVAKGSIQSFADLPAKGVPTGVVIQITGDGTNQFDDYYVKFDGKVWVECVKPSSTLTFDAATMPHVLVREADGTFTFREATWDNRAAGDDTSNGAPSFVGKTISDITFHKNRLGFVSDENTVLSSAGKFFNFWRTTVTALLDGDPVDIGVNHPQVSKIRHAVPYGDSLTLFSDKTQFALTSQGLLTAKTASISPTTALPASVYAKPVLAGESLYFLADTGNSTKLYEYTLNAEIQKLVGAEMTAHASHYIPSGISDLTGSIKHSLLAIRTSGAPTKLYIYQWVVQGTQRLQSAFHSWDFGTGRNVVGARVIDSDIYALIDDSAGLWLEHVNIDPARNDANFSYWVALDRRVHSDNVAAPSYDAGNDRTSYTLPYTVPATIVAAYALDGTGTFRGMTADVDSFTGTTLRLKGNTTTQKFYFGIPYRFRSVLTKLLPKKQARNGETVIADGRLQVRYIQLVHAANCVNLVALIKRKGRADYEFVIGSYLLGTDETDKAPQGAEGVARVPVMANAETTTIEFYSDSHIPCTLISAEWEGQLHVKARPSN